MAAPAAVWDRYHGFDVVSPLGLPIHPVDFAEAAVELYFLQADPFCCELYIYITVHGRCKSYCNGIAVFAFTTAFGFDIKQYGVFSFFCIVVIRISISLNRYTIVAK